MSKSGQAAYDAQERGADNYLAEEGERRHEIDQRITALEEAIGGQVLYHTGLRHLASELTKYLRENGYPKQPEPMKLEDDDIPF